MTTTQSQTLQFQTLSPVQPRKGLHQEVAERLRAFIIEGVFAPGTRLNERVLTEQLAVSRTPLREAYKMLAAEGLITLLPNVGAEVTKLSNQEVLDTFDVLIALEGRVGELAAQRASDQEIQTLETMNADMRQHRQAQDLAAYYQANRAIHFRMLAMTRNAVLSNVHQRLNGKLEGLRFRSNLHVEKWERAMQEHDDMIGLLKKRDANGLATTLKRHLEYKRDTVLEQLK